MNTSTQLRSLLISVALVPFAGVVHADRRGINDTSSSPHVVMRSVGVDDVEWTKGFWADRFAVCRDAVIPRVEKSLLNPENSAQLQNFQVAAGVLEGVHKGTHWSDGDCYKWIESLAHLHMTTGDESLVEKMDAWIELIGEAQEADGYISTNIQLKPELERWQKISHHELYNMGHLLTAACIHHRATGKDDFLSIARKLGDYLHRTFAPRPPELARFGFNPSNIMGSVELYRTSGDRKYLELAEVFMSNRGSKVATKDELKNRWHQGGTDLTQDRVPLRKERQAVGHCVCATYLYSGAADLCAETGDAELKGALEQIWESAAYRRMYITGAVGSFRNGTSTRGDPVHEAFGNDYHVPSRTGYNETCSNIGMAMWSRRMLALTGNARYTDLMERVLYNGGLSPVAIDGQGFFYCNPLKWTGKTEDLSKHHTAQRWAIHSCFCCPPQMARTLAKLGGWAYDVSKDGVWVHLYGGSRLTTNLPDGTPIGLIQETEYPWDGRIQIKLERVPAREMTIMLRIPGWANGASIRVNGAPSNLAIKAGTYARLHRRWSARDIIELDLPMETQLIEAHPKAANLANKVAVMRGPLAYCAEFPLADDGQRVWDEGVFIPENAELTTRFDENLLGGVIALDGRALTRKGRDQYAQDASLKPARSSADWPEKLYRPFRPRELPPPTSGTVEIALIPYFAWANRGESLMEVWIPLARADGR